MTHASTTTSPWWATKHTHRVRERLRQREKREVRKRTNRLEKREKKWERERLYIHPNTSALNFFFSFYEVHFTAYKDVKKKNDSVHFGKDYFYQLILLFNLFLLLFMGHTALFSIIHGSHCTISTNFYL